MLQLEKGVMLLVVYYLSLPHHQTPWRSGEVPRVGSPPPFSIHLAITSSIMPPLAPLGGPSLGPPLYSTCTLTWAQIHCTLILFPVFCPQYTMSAPWKATLSSPSLSLLCIAKGEAQNRGSVKELWVDWSCNIWGSPEILKTKMYKTLLKMAEEGLPDGPVAKTLCSQCWGSEFNPWSRN